MNVLKRASLVFDRMKYGLASWRPYSSKSELDLVLGKLKLTRSQRFVKAENTKGTLEVLKNAHESLDAIHIRSRQPHVLYLRSELLLQRMEYLKPMGLLKRQKRKLLEKAPPVLLLVHDLDAAEVNYLRGIIRVQKNSSEEFIHVCHPYPSKILMRVFDLKNRVGLIQEELAMAGETVLRFLLSMPVFLLHGTEDAKVKFQTMHKYALPKGYNLDKHTAEVLPPVYSSHPGIDPRLFRKDSCDETTGILPKIQLADVLDYSYPQHYGKGQPEDLTEFLIRAERTELKPRYNKVM